MTKDIDRGDGQQSPNPNYARSTSRSERRELAGSPLHRSKKSRREGHHRRKEKSEREDKPPTPAQMVATELEEHAGHIFFVDRKGDAQNAVFGGNHTGIIPKYRRAGYGSLIGLDRRYRISDDGLRAFGYPTYDGRRKGHISSLLNCREKTSRDGIEQVKAEVAGGKVDGVRLQYEYIAVCSTNSKRRKRELTREVVEGTQDIVTDPADSALPGVHSPGGSDTESESDTSAGEQEDSYSKFRDDTQRQHLLSLNRATKERPADAATWLALIAHQDHIFNEERGSSAVEQSLAEVKLALYEKALMKVSDPKSRERLIKELMNQGAEVWDINTLSKKWQIFVQASSSLELWLQYINFQQATAVTFVYEGCLSMLGECLKKARGETESAARDQISIYLLLRLTVLMSHSGYTERAIAVWQSLLEFAFFRPNQLDSSTEQSSFQAFWESEVPRIGEECAVGWAVSKSLEVPSRSDPVPRGLSPGDEFETWALRERELAAASIMPARTLDEVAEDDPFRVILYPDIEAYLFKPDTITGDALLINAFLKFCGLPALHSPGCRLSCKWWGDVYLSQCSIIEQSSSIEGTTVSDTKSLFAFDASSSIFPRATTEDGRVKISWQRSVLKQLAALLVDNDSLAEYVVAFEASMELKEGRKYAKSLLKSRSSSLRLYNAYALLECRLDRFESAEHVWSTAINMSVSTNEQQDVMLLWSSWVFECLQRGDTSRVKTILSSIPDGQAAKEQAIPDPFSNAALQLRTKNYLELCLSQQLSLRQENLISHLTELLAIFEYLSGSCSISAALVVYDTTFGALAKVSASSSLIEVLHQSRAQLLHLHPTLSPHGYRPAEINKCLASSLCKFSSNPVFHQLYQEHTRRIGLLERIREVVPESVSASGCDNDSISSVPFLFAIRKELSRPSYAGSTQHSIRASFERGVAATKAGVQIWGWYINWETSLITETEPVVKPERKREIEPQRNKAVDVYYRGIRACPWAKELYMLGFSESALRGAIGGSELRKVYDVMMEKGLRIHVDLDQVVR